MVQAPRACRFFFLLLILNVGLYVSHFHLEIYAYAKMFTKCFLWGRSTDSKSSRCTWYAPRVQPRQQCLILGGSKGYFWKSDRRSSNKCVNIHRDVFLVARFEIVRNLLYCCCCCCCCDVSTWSKSSESESRCRVCATWLSRNFGAHSRFAGLSLHASTLETLLLISVSF